MYKPMNNNDFVKLIKTIMHHSELDEDEAKELAYAIGEIAA